MTWHLDPVGLGTRHNRLASTAEQLRSDGETELAIEYSRRAMEDETAYVALRELGQAVAELSSEHASIQACGVVMAEWLLASGWGPPPSIACRTEEI